MIRQVTIVGTGLIGGSLALALRELGVRVIGSDRQPVLDRAIEMGAIDGGIADPAAACEGSDVVVLATPVGMIIDLLERLGPLMPKTTLITDVGSTKSQIVSRAREVFGEAAGARFLGGHPMAGKEHSGIDRATRDLFKGAAWIFTSQETPKENAAEWVEVVGELGARVFTMTTEEHDRICAWTSHLPQMISTALASTLLEELDQGDVHAIGGRALREMTRIASSPYSMWRDIALTNSKNIEAALSKLEQRLAHIRENLRSPELRNEFERGHRFRGE